LIPPSDNQLDEDLGVVTLEAFQDWRWVERRVESVTFLDDTTVKRRVSVDFAVPEFWVSALPQNSGEPPTFRLPLALLRKQGLIGFDLRDEAGEALPLLTREENSSIAQATLLQVARAIGEDPPTPMRGAVPKPIRDELKLITSGPAESALIVWSALERSKEFPDEEPESAECREWRRLLTNDDKFVRLARDFAEGFPLIVPVTCELGTRRILKYSYQTAVPPRRPSSRRRQLARSVGWRARTEQVDTPSIGQGGCFHLEVQAPEGLQITRGLLSPAKPVKPTVWQKALPDVIKLGSERVHLHIAALGHAGGTAWVNFRARPAVISRAGFATGMLTTVALTIAALAHSVLQSNIEPAVALLLLVPTALSIYVARPQEPIVTTGLLLGQRMLAACCGALAIIAASILVTGQTCRSAAGGVTCEQWPATPWLLTALAVCAAIITVVLTATLVFTANPPEKLSLEA
jgi:hypothetical protein